MSNAERTLLDSLRSRRMDDGGFAAVEGVRRSDTESTALAALALGAGGHDGADQARRWLRGRQGRGGGWTLYPDVDVPSWAGAWAALALAADPATPEAVLRRAGRGLVAREGRRPGLLSRLLLGLADPEDGVSHDLSLRGWPWHEAAGSWVEPTATAVLALRRLGRRTSVDGSDARVAEGRALLRDRMCAQGGWNYGNTRVLGVALEPYPDTTALALLALQGETGPGVAKGIDALGRLIAERASDLALGLAALAFAVHGRDADADTARRRLAQKLRADGVPADTRSRAVALLALAEGRAALALETR